MVAKKETLDSKVSTKRGSKKPQRICEQCEHPQDAEKNYYTAKNKIFFPKSKIAVCKSCINENIDISNLDEVFHVLRTIDAPFLHNFWDKAKDESESDSAVFGTYMSNLNLVQYRKKTWKDSEFGKYLIESEKSKVSKDIYSSDDQYLITPEMKRKWMGHTDEDDIRWLQEFYDDFVEDYDDDTPIQRQLYQNIAVTQLQANKAVASGNATLHEKHMNTLSKLMGDANIKPVQDSGGDAANINAWGLWVEKIEETEPIPDPLPQFKDVDGIWKYVKTWFIDHFAKVFDVKPDKEKSSDESDTEE